MAAQSLGTLLNEFDSEWIGVIHQHAPKFMAGYADETIRSRILLSYLRKYGKIMTGASGPMCVWNNKFQQQPVSSAGDAGTLTFQRHDLWRQSALNWRGYVATDSMTEKEYLMTRGPGQILDRYGEMIPALMEAMTDNFGGELYIDGNATNNANRIHGLESWLAENTPVVADTIATPNDSYAGLSTVLGTEGGNWTDGLGVGNFPNAALAKDWPNGQDLGKSKGAFDYYSPLLVNWSSDVWGSGTNKWVDNCEEVIRQAILWLTNKGGPKGRPKLVLLNVQMYADYLNFQSNKQRIIIPHKESQDLGFEGTMNQDGVAIYSDFECPGNTGYLFNVENYELASLDKVLFGYRGPDFSIRDRAYLFYSGFWGNARSRPRHFGKLKDYAAV